MKRNKVESKSLVLYNFRMDTYSINWLKRELPVLVENKVISQESAARITEYYDSKLNAQEAEQKKQLELSEKKKEKNIPLVLTIIAASLIALGIISLIAYNWSAIGRLQKSLAAILLLTGTQGAAIFIKVTGRDSNARIKESFSLFWAILFGAVIAFVSQIYRFPSNPEAFTLVWTISSILVLYVFKAESVFYFSIALILSGLFMQSSISFTAKLMCALLLVPFSLNKKRCRNFMQVLLPFLLLCLASDTNKDFSNILFYTTLSCIGALYFKSQVRQFKNTGGCILGISAILLLMLYNARSYNKAHIFETAVSGAASAALLLYASIIPFVKKVRAKSAGEIIGKIAALEPQDFLCLSPIAALIASLFPDTEYKFHSLFNLPAQKFWSIFTSSYSLVIFSLAAFFALYALHNKGRAIKCAYCFLILLLFGAIKAAEEIQSFASIFIILFCVIIFALCIIYVNSSINKTPDFKIAIFSTRILTSAFLIYMLWFSRNSDSCWYFEKEKLYAVILPYIVCATGGIFILTLHCIKTKSVPYSSIDAGINLFFIIALFAAGQFLPEQSSRKIILNAFEILFILNAVFAFVMGFVFKNKIYSVYSGALFIQFAAELYDFSAVNDSDTTVMIIVFSCIAFLLHIISKRKNIKALDIFGALIGAVLIFYQTSIESDFYTPVLHMTTWIYAAYILIVFAILIFHSIRQKQIFNAALFLLCFYPFILPQIPVNFRVFLTLPVCLLFCVYYFYVAWKDNSSKTANFTALYFALVLMTKFFFNGYGLVPQGITLILLGVFVLTANKILSNKKNKIFQEMKNERE